MLSAECAWRRRFIVLDGRKKDVASNGAASSAPLVSPSRPGWITKRQLLGMSTAPPRVSAFSRISSSRATLDTPTSRTTSSTRERVSCPLFFHLSSVLFRFISFFFVFFIVVYPNTLPRPPFVLDSPMRASFPRIYFRFIAKL